MSQANSRSAAETMLRWEMLRILAGARSHDKVLREAENPPLALPGFEGLNGPLDASAIDSVNQALYSLALQEHEKSSPIATSDNAGHGSKLLALHLPQFVAHGSSDEKLPALADGDEDDLFSGVTNIRRSVSAPSLKRRPRLSAQSNRSSKLSQNLNSDAVQAVQDFSPSAEHDTRPLSSSQSRGKVSGQGGSGRLPDGKANIPRIAAPGRQTGETGILPVSNQTPGGNGAYDPVPRGPAQESRAQCPAPATSSHVLVEDKLTPSKIPAETQARLPPQPGPSAALATSLADRPPHVQIPGKAMPNQVDSPQPPGQRQQIMHPGVAGAVHKAVEGTSRPNISSRFPKRPVNQTRQPHPAVASTRVPTATSALGSTHTVQQTGRPGGVNMNTSTPSNPPIQRSAKAAATSSRPVPIPATLAQTSHLAVVPRSPPAAAVAQPHHLVASAAGSPGRTRPQPSAALSEAVNLPAPASRTTRDPARRPLADSTAGPRLPQKAIPATSAPISHLTSAAPPSRPTLVALPAPDGHAQASMTNNRLPGAVAANDLPSEGGNLAPAHIPGFAPTLSRPRDPATGRMKPSAAPAPAYGARPVAKAQQDVVGSLAGQPNDLPAHAPEQNAAVGRVQQAQQTPHGSAASPVHPLAGLNTAVQQSLPAISELKGSLPQSRSEHQAPRIRSSSMTMPPRNMPIQQTTTIEPQAQQRSAPTAKLSTKLPPPAISSGAKPPPPVTDENISTLVAPKSGHAIFDANPRDSPSLPSSRSDMDASKMAQSGHSQPSMPNQPRSQPSLRRQAAIHCKVGSPRYSSIFQQSGLPSSLLMYGAESEAVSVDANQSKAKPRYGTDLPHNDPTAHTGNIDGKVRFQETAETRNSLEGAAAEALMTVGTLEYDLAVNAEYTFNSLDSLAPDLAKGMELVDGDFSADEMLELLLAGRLPRDFRSERNSRSALLLIARGALYSAQAVLGPAGRSFSVALAESCGII